jgi:hypothetical protein
MLFKEGLNPVIGWDAKSPRLTYVINGHPGRVTVFPEVPPKGMFRECRFSFRTGRDETIRHEIEGSGVQVRTVSSSIPAWRAAVKYGKGAKIVMFDSSRVHQD